MSELYTCGKCGKPVGDSRIVTSITIPAGPSIGDPTYAVRMHVRMANGNSHPMVPPWYVRWAVGGIQRWVNYVVSR